MDTDEHGSVGVPPNEADCQRRECVLANFRREFHAYYQSFGNDDTAVLSFVHYEGIQDHQVNGIIGAAEPFIVGETLVREFGCRWTVVGPVESRCFALEHRLLGGPFKLEPFRWSHAKKRLPKRWFVKLNRLVRPGASGP